MCVRMDRAESGDGRWNALREASSSPHNRSVTVSAVAIKYASGDKLLCTKWTERHLHPNKSIARWEETVPGACRILK